MAMAGGPFAGRSVMSLQPSAMMSQRAVCIIVLICAFSASAAAQFQMPDPKQMAGIPRPVTDLPNGTVSVRLIRGQLSNNITELSR